jgi:hypothetical protein
MNEKDEILKKLLSKKKSNVDDKFVLETIKKKRNGESGYLNEQITLKEIAPVVAAKTDLVPSTNDLVQQVSNVLATANANTNSFKDKEIEGMRRTIAEMMQKISTLSWGGGGTGIVRVFDADDFDRNTVGEGKFMKFSNGWFVLDDINPGEIVNNTTVVTTNTYTVVNTDYYIGVNYAGPVTITIPASISSGREVVIKDESGNCETNNITVNAKVDNDANGFILAINNGAVHMLYRGDSWRII